MRSSTCKGNNDQYLEEYHNETAALIDAERIKKEYGRNLKTLHCRTCGYWHLTGFTTSRVCMFCTDSGLFQKDIYSTRQEAETKAVSVGRQNRIKLYAYKCPHGSGWHLTRRKG